MSLAERSFVHGQLIFKLVYSSLIHVHIYLFKLDLYVIMIWIVPNQVEQNKFT